MRLEVNTATREVYLVMSHRNLASLLAKLEGAPADSAMRIYAGGIDEGGNQWSTMVRAETDSEHYQDRPFLPGEMHPETERLMELLQPGWSQRTQI